MAEAAQSTGILLCRDILFKMVRVQGLGFDATKDGFSKPQEREDFR